MCGAAPRLLLIDSTRNYLRSVKNLLCLCMTVTQRARGVLTFVPPRDFKSRLIRTVRRKSLAHELGRHAKSLPC